VGLLKPPQRSFEFPRQLGEATNDTVAVSRNVKACALMKSAGFDVSADPAFYSK